MDEGELKLKSNIQELMHILEKYYLWEFDDEAKLNTPDRVVKAYGEFKNKRLYNKFTDFNSDSVPNNLIAITGIQYYAFCSHHLLPFFGKVNIVYLPNKKILGISKFARIVNSVAYSSNVQEIMTQQIMNKIIEAINPQAALVLVTGSHLCSMMRGVEEQSMEIKTEAIHGDMFTNISMKEEALKLMGVK